MRPPLPTAPLHQPIRFALTGHPQIHPNHHMRLLDLHDLLATRSVRGINPRRRSSLSGGAEDGCGRLSAALKTASRFDAACMPAITFHGAQPRGTATKGWRPVLSSTGYHTARGCACRIWPPPSFVQPVLLDGGRRARRAMRWSPDGWWGSDAVTSRVHWFSADGSGPVASLFLRGNGGDELIGEVGQIGAVLPGVADGDPWRAVC